MGFLLDMFALFDVAREVGRGIRDVCHDGKLAFDMTRLAVRQTAFIGKMMKELFLMQHRRHIKASVRCFEFRFMHSTDENV